MYGNDGRLIGDPPERFGPQMPPDDDVFLASITQRPRIAWAPPPRLELALLPATSPATRMDVPELEMLARSAARRVHDRQQAVIYTHPIIEHNRRGPY